MDQHNNELQHHGIKGMRWGVRRARGYVSPGRYISRKRQLAADKRDLASLDKGEHLSVGVTKKRQAAFDKRDRAKLENRIAKNERIIAEKQAKKQAKQKPDVKKMSDEELRKRLNRLQMEKQYNQLTKKETSAGRKFVQDIALNATKQTASNYISKYMTKGIDSLIENAVKKK